MEIGVGLPTTVPDIDGQRLVEWARRAEEHGFSTLGVLDRLVYDNYEPLTSLAAAAAVTQRIKLATTILLAAYRPGTPLLAKQLATIHEISGGRLVVGAAAGGREDDFQATGATYADRGRRLDAMLTELRGIWDGKETDTGVAGIGPRPGGAGPEIIVGGHTPAAMRRAARHANGWIAGGSSATGYADLAAQARAAWQAEGRTDSPRLVALVYACLGPGAARTAESYLRAYYAFIGPKAEMAAKAVITDAGSLRETTAAYAEAGCDELLVFPCTADQAQLDLLAEAALP
ncbi:LLM class flavin-dependent oxidoreductase [Streptomyces sp. NBC_01795]|uniref:LLM class flavin-dependent oxidoreductase n=1 Tax=Streptomyces sp. NBC_01795 TaxID=2975943 RepID=UPI002DDBE3EC|nr:LLM class flavin-dependent oxidoreductase [Streptomyces sp. NBC_01795]WSA95509.1 LLM class flavin-dependent oxidoreductase [Streptomyces sp. NBC_01795]